MKEGFLHEYGIAYRTNDIDPKRPTVVFIHGLSGSASAWEPYEKALEQSHNVVTYDLRGHGVSVKYGLYTDYKLKHFARDLHELLEHLEITTCTLVAHSMGSLVAVSYLHYFTNNVRSVLFLAPNYHLYATFQALFIRPLLAVSTGIFDLIPFKPTEGKRFDYSSIFYSRDWSAKRIIPEVLAVTLRIYLYCLRHVYVFSEDHWWRKITVPTVILHGTKDSFVPYRLSKKLAKLMPNATLKTIKGANHMLVINDRQEIIEEIKKITI